MKTTEDLEKLESIHAETKIRIELLRKHMLLMEKRTPIDINIKIQKETDKNLKKSAHKIIFRRVASRSLIKNVRPFKLVDPPGKNWATFSEFILTEKDYKFKFEPYLSDFQESYKKALYNRRIWKCRYLTFQYTLIFIKNICFIPLSGLLETVKKMAK